jgi:hypothetical protein
MGSNSPAAPTFSDVQVEGPTPALLGITPQPHRPRWYTDSMPDTPGHDATRRDDVHTMTIRELEARIAQAGIVMSRRQITRHCKAGTFDGQKLPAVNNVEEWFVAPASVEKGIADIKTLHALRSRRDATRRDMPGPDAPATASPINADTSGHDATRRDVADKGIKDDKELTDLDTSRYVGQLETWIKEKDDIIGMLRGELTHRNEEIVRRNERERETNILIRGLQNLVLRLQAPSAPTADVLDDDPAMADREVKNSTAA